MNGKIRGYMQKLKMLGRNSSGSALVETALAMPLLATLLLGAVEMGDLAYKATEMSNSARAAVHYAAMNSGAFTDCNGTLAGGTCTDTSGYTSGMVTAAKQDAPRTVATCTQFAVTATSSCTCSSSSACIGSGAYTCASGKPVVTVSVTTSAQCSPVSSVPGLFGGAFTLQGFAQQQVLN